jgi:hypothetical protein
MAGTAIRQRGQVTAKRTLIGQIIDRLAEIGVLLSARHPTETELVYKYIMTINTFTVAKLRDNSAELMRITAMLNSLKRDLKKDFEITDKIRTLQDLIAVAEREFELSE